MKTNTLLSPKIFSYFFLFLIALLWIKSPPSRFASVIALGQAQVFNNNEILAQKQALRNAQRSAIEQEVGVFIDANTITQNWRILQDKIYAKSNGYISQYEVLKNEISPDGQKWLVTISAEVAKGKIENDLQALNILQQELGHRKFVLFYALENNRSFPPQANPVISARNVIAQKFIDAGFRLQKYRKQSFNTALAEKYFEDLAAQDITIFITFEALDVSPTKHSRSDFSSASVMVRLNVYDIATQDSISNEQSAKKHFTNASPGSYAWNQALNRAAEKSALTAGNLSVQNISNYYRSLSERGRSYTIIFNNYSEDDEDRLLQMAEEIEGFQSFREIKNMPGLLSIEYFSNIKLSEFRRLIRQQASEEGIDLQTKVSSGERLVFVKPGTE